ncbi:MAG TPA: hypothetical protein VMS22_25860 [Candidatus Eisenbacteria bacterium]|nr:hypothetical protein [Candidatus Eisenbacteria bacterium]
MPTVVSPEGPVGPGPRRLSPLPSVLAGVRIGVLDNRKPNARLLLTTMAERLAERTGARLVLVTEKANAAVRGEMQVLERLRDEADVVLTGSGD